MTRRTHTGISIAIIVNKSVIVQYIKIKKQQMVESESIAIASDSKRGKDTHWQQLRRRTHEDLMAIFKKIRILEGLPYYHRHCNVIDEMVYESQA